MTTWIILKKGPHGKIMHNLSAEFAHIFYSVTQVGLEKCAILLHVPKLVIISKGEYKILLEPLPSKKKMSRLNITCRLKGISIILVLCVPWTNKVGK